MKSQNYSPEIYLTAIKEYVKVDDDTSKYLFIYSNSEVDSLLNKRRIDGKGIICIGNDEDVFLYVDQVATILEIEPLMISGKNLTVKINHNLLVRLEYPFDLEKVERCIASARTATELVTTEQNRRALVPSCPSWHKKNLAKREVLD